MPCWHLHINRPECSRFCKVLIFSAALEMLIASPIERYLCMTIANEILMHFRSIKKTQGDLSLSEALESGEAGSLSLMDVISVPDDMLENISIAETHMRLRELVCQRLTERECQIITMRYGLTGMLPKTQREVAGLLDISRSYVSRIEKRALKKLEDAMGAEM